MIYNDDAVSSSNGNAHIRSTENERQPADPGPSIQSFSDYPVNHSVVAAPRSSKSIKTPSISCDSANLNNSNFCENFDNSESTQAMDSITNLIIKDNCNKRGNFSNCPLKRSNFNQNDEIATRDLLSNLKSLIFSDDEPSKQPDKQEEISPRCIGDLSSPCPKQASLASESVDSVSNEKSSSSNHPSETAGVASPNFNASSTRTNTTSPALIEPVDPIPGPSNYVAGMFSSSTPMNVKNDCDDRAANNSEEISPRKNDRHSKSGRRAKRSGPSQDKRFATISKLPSISVTAGCPQQHLEGLNMNLPKNWEARLDAHGRIFYIDHERRTTTWQRPNPPSDSGNVNLPKQGTTMLSNEVSSDKDQSNAKTTVSIGNTSAKGTKTSESTSLMDDHQSSANSLLNDSTEQHRALLNRRYTLRRTISARRQSKSSEQELIDFDDGPQETTLDPISVKNLIGSSGDQAVDHDAIDGNCMSGPSTQRARSYNLCMDQPVSRSQQQSRIDPVASTSRVSNDNGSTQSTASPAPSGRLSDAMTSAHSSSGSSDSRSAPASTTEQHQATQQPQDQLGPSICCPPALRFLNRSDFFNVLHLNDEALMLYNSSSNVRYIVGHVRRDKTNSKYERYQHNKDLVAFLNKFTMKDEPMPVGWEVKLDDQGKCFFIDHIRKATTYVDPRLPTEVPVISPHQAPPRPHRTPHSVQSVQSSSISNIINEDPREDDPSQSHVDQQQLQHQRQPQSQQQQQQQHQVSDRVPAQHTSISQDPSGESSLQSRIASSPIPSSSSRQRTVMSYEERVVAFLKQSNIFDLIKSRKPASNLLNSAMRDKINQIRKGGVQVLKKHGHDVNLAMLISSFEAELDAIGSGQTPTSRILHRSHINRANAPGKRDFEEKLRSFYRKLEQKNFGHGPNKLKLSIRRDHILEDAFTKVMSINSKKDLRKSRLYVSFTGEEGLDYGGPSREFFFLLSRELFNPYYGK
jgi:hypothetical protein